MKTSKKIELLFSDENDANSKTTTTPSPSGRINPSSNNNGTEILSLEGMKIINIQ